MICVKIANKERVKKMNIVPELYYDSYNGDYPYNRVNTVDMTLVKKLVTNAASSLVTACKLLEGFCFTELHTLEITTANPCRTIPSLCDFRYPALRKLIFRCPLLPCCDLSVQLFIRNFVKHNILPWVQYCIRKCYPYLDKNVVKMICSVIWKSADYETWLSGQKEKICERKKLKKE